MIPYSACQILKNRNHQITVHEIFSFYSEAIPPKALINVQHVLLVKNLIKVLLIIRDFRVCMCKKKRQ